MVFPTISSIALASAIILIAGFIASIIHSLIRAILDKRISRAASIWTARIVQYAIYAFAIYVAFYNVLKLNFAGIAASAGILGIAVAFSSQQIVQNVIAGVLITIRRPIQLEDYISIGFPDVGICKVKDITIFQVVLKNVDGRLFYVPNATILTQVITNYTKSNALRMSVPLNITNANNAEKIKGIAMNVAKRDSRILPNIPLKQKNILKDIAPQIYSILGDSTAKKNYDPSIITKGLSGSGMSLEIRFWITDIAKRDEIISHYLDSLSAALQNEGIKEL